MVPPHPDSRAFTADSNGKLSEIVTDVELSLPFLPGTTLPPEPTPVSARALWDTGATNCAITEAKAAEIGLSPITKVKVFHADGESIQNVYLLNLTLPNHFIIPMVKATECKSAGGNFDFIIGMEIITLGDLAITNFGNKSTVSFRMPPDRRIDYAGEIELSKKMVGLGRNERCPCGSGKKFKQCHGT